MQTTPVGTIITAPDGSRWVREGAGAWRHYPPQGTSISREGSLCSDDVDSFIASREGGDRYVIQYPVWVPPETATDLTKFTELLQATGVPYTVDLNANPGPILHITDSRGNPFSVVAFDASGNYISWRSA